jgi:ABC-2 type transport system ATP-binding protein
MPPQVRMLLRTENLTKRYGSFTALDALTFEIAPGEVVGLLGPNGSGKTTALRLIMGFLRPTSGSAWICGHHCWFDSVAARRQVAYLPSELRLYENMTGRQLITFLLELRGQSIRDDTLQLARRFDIDIDRPIANLSSGMKRKVALLQMLAPQAPLILMDEPTNALDPNMRDLFLEQVERARDRGQAVLFSSHVLSEVERVCDRVAILRRGQLVYIENRAHMQAGRLLHIRFQGPCLPMPELPGLHVREQHADQITIEYEGSMPDLLRWLANQPVSELRMEPLGLNAIYSRYHGPLA